MKYKNLQKNKGFVILFAVTLSAIILSIALGISDIALKEVKFATSARDTNDAFFAADTGIESVLFDDKLNPMVPPPGGITSEDFVVFGLGSLGVSCAKINIEKNNASDPSVIKTTIISKGYNVGDANCDPTSSNRVERELKVTYHVDISAGTTP